MMTDPISDMLTRLRNAQSVGKTEVVLPFSKIKQAIAHILEQEGFVDHVETLNTKPFPSLRIVCKYEAGQPKIQAIRRISKPGRRLYAKSNELPRVLSDMGIAILSTPNGLMTNKQARARKIGGEIICEVY